jgi:hypothetical protein
MACLIHAPEPQTDYLGTAALFEYTNGDGGFVRTNCGQAAAATFLTFHGKLAPLAERARQVMAEIERHFPPDNLGGMFGTSRRRVIRICKAFGQAVCPIEGEAELKSQLGRQQPVIVMLGVRAGTLLRFNLPGGHWMVAYGYDAEHVYLSNWGKMPWPDFRAGWSALVPRLIGMRFRGLTAIHAHDEGANAPGESDERVTGQGLRLLAQVGRPVAGRTA